GAVQDERRIAKGELAAIVKAKQAGNAGQPVVISADKNVKYAAVLEVMDELQKQAVKRVGLSVKPAQ
ncbi:MAG: biopolymer transporter ExbD, partial [Betaproteobacteria bacterium]|nr:biopolymer transporter ExbD [Betaproteobacteria bacterium]